MHPLGVLYLHSFFEDDSKETLRISGDLARLKEYLTHIQEHPDLRLIYHYPISKAGGGCWSCLVTVVNERILVANKKAPG